jgi:putative hydrolase of the HAD superfamily
MIKAILFDLDETIILDDPVLEEAFRAAAELAAPLGADTGRLARRAREIARRLWAEGPYAAYCDRIGHSAGEGLWARYTSGDHPAIAGLREWAPGYRLAAWREALAEQHLRDEALLPAMVERFQQARRRYPRFPEIDPLLAALKGRGYLLGIVTNGVPDLQREKIAGCGVAHLFDASVASGEIDCGKPDPGIFRHICRELQVEPGECVMVGDNPERDVAGAIASGMRSVWVQRHGRAPDPRYPADLACTDLSAMLPWLDELA